jgi:tRNA(Ile)-lysidine synthase
MNESPMLEKKILARWPIERWSQLTVVVGCSGGADSTALLIALHRLCPPTTTLVVAHFNHKLRGAESEADASFVRNLAERLQLQLIEGNTTDAQLVDEASLRAIRYQFLERTALQLGARYVAVGHHADDQVETVLHNLFRGAGLSGLRGMSAFRDLGQDLVLARPLIDAWREDVINYLKSHKQSFRSDSSNAGEVYTRNRIRNRLLPLIQEHYGRDVRSAVANAADLLGDVFVDVDLRSKRWSSENLVNVNQQQFKLPYITSASPAWHIIQQAIVHEYHRRGWSLGGYNRGHWQALQAFLNGKSAPAIASLSMLPDHVTVRMTSDGFLFERTPTKDVVPPAVRAAELD